MNEPWIPPDRATFEPRQELDRLARRAFTVGGGAAVVAAAGAMLAPHAFVRAYLEAWLLWLGVALGLLAIGMLSHVSGGSWGVVLRRVFEASGRTVPFFLVLFVPVFLGRREIYPWADPEVVAHDPLIQHKSIYLSSGSFLLRAVVYFAAWTLLAHFLSRWSRRQDEGGELRYTTAMRRLSAGGLVVYVLTGTFASVDWLMSLDPHWFSSLFGMAFVAGQGLSAFAFAVPVMLFLSRGTPFRALVRTKEVHDYGKLMLAFVMIWTYFMISQYLIIWSGNLPEEITWYLARSRQGWQAVSLLLVLGHFALPFFLLLSRDVTKRPRRLLWVAAWVLAMRWLDLHWLVAPSVGGEGVVFHWLDAVIPVAIGGLWIGLLVRGFRGRAAVPLRAPELAEVTAHG